MSTQKNRSKARPNSLEAVALRELGVRLDKEHQKSDWDDTLSPYMKEYAAKDAQVLLPLTEALESKVKDANLGKVLEIEQRAFPAMLWMSNAGVPFDAEGWKKYLERVEGEIECLRAMLNSLAPSRPRGGEWNWNSHQQVKEVFALVGLILPNVKEETLSRYNHDLAELLLEYRKASKMVSAFGYKLLRSVREDGRIYPSWRQIGTETGRMSCSKPNLQQLPPEVRRYVRAPEGRALVWADYAQAEIRILAEASGEPALIEAFRAEKDPYKATAAGTFGISEDRVTDQQRSDAKLINLSIIYGTTARGLAQKLGTDVRTASQRMNQYFAAHPRVKAFLEECVSEALRNGEVRTLTGRIRRFGNASTMSSREKEVVKREAMNFPMQGTCADGLKLANALLYKRRCECPGAFPVVNLHDEIVVECGETDVEAAAAWLEQAMKDGMAEVLTYPEGHGSRVPVEVEVKSGKTWIK